MKISHLLSQAQSQLEQAQVENPRLDARLLLRHVTQFSKEKIIFNPELVIQDEMVQDFLALIKQRKQRRPISHIIGKREFYGRDFKVSGDVLDPRCDSESLIEMVLANYQQDVSFNFLEIGCGSGCLTMTLLQECKNAQATALDISGKALEIAQHNANLHDVDMRVNFLESDLFSKLEPHQRFDLIISNPPYIASADIAELQDEVKIHEPRLALDGGEDGLDFYRHIALKAGDFMKDNAKVIVEIGINQEGDIADIFAKQGFVLESQKRDLSHVIRNLCFIKDDNNTNS